MRVAVVAEFYPRAHDPVLGVWAHRQALATRDAGAELTVLVLHRVVPPRSDFTARAALTLIRQPRLAELDGLPVRYLKYASPPRASSYARWGAWVAPALRRALAREGPFDLVHAHNAIPAADAVRRAGWDGPLVISVHGGDVLWTAAGRVPHGRQAVARAFGQATRLLANSAGIARLAAELGAPPTDVVHLGSDLPEPDTINRSRSPLLVTVGHLVARKRHGDVLEALTRLPPDVRYLVIGDGPERAALQQLARQLNLSDRVEFAGQLDPAETLRRARQAWLFVMPSTEEALGVAYLEAMAAGIPAIGTRGEPGPEEIAAHGGGLERVPANDPEQLAKTITNVLGETDKLGQQARQTVEQHFSWVRCGQRTVAAYREAEALRRRDGA